MGDSFFTRCRYIRQYALLSCQSETPFLSARHRASSCCTTVEEPWFLDPHFLISLWTVFYQRYCDRGRKSARCFKLLQFDSGPFIFSFFFLSLIPIHDARFNVRSEYGYFDDFRQVTNMCLKRSIRIDIREINLGILFRDIELLL